MKLTKKEWSRGQVISAREHEKIIEKALKSLTGFSERTKKRVSEIENEREEEEINQK